jgi:hypothetical protein
VEHAISKVDEEQDTCLRGLAKYDIVVCENFQTEVDQEFRNKARPYLLFLESRPLPKNQLIGTREFPARRMAKL